MFEDEEVKVDCKIQTIRFVQRLLLTFIGKYGSQPDRVNLEIVTPPGLEGKLVIQCSPVRYTPDGAQAVVMAKLSEPVSISPELFVALSIPGRNEAAMTLLLPIGVNESFG